MTPKTRDVRILLESSEVGESLIYFRFEFNVSDVDIGETGFLKDKNSLFYRVLIRERWLSKSMSEIVEYSTNLRFSEDGRVLEIRCKKFGNSSPDVASEEAESFHLEMEESMEETFE